MSRPSFAREGPFSSPRQERLGLLFAALCAANGAFAPAFAKLTTGRADALLVTTATVAFAALGAGVLLAARGELRALVARRRLPWLVAIGALGTALAYLLFYEGARRTTAIETALCLQAEPIYALFLARVFLGHPITQRRLAAIAAIGVGIGLALEPRGFSGWVGVGLLLATPLGWQAGHLVTLRRLAGVSPELLTGARYLYGGALLLAIWLATGGLGRVPDAAQLASLGPLLLVQGLVLSYTGTLFWYQTIARLDLARATSIVVPSIPLLSLGASFLLLGEVAGARQWLGLLLTAAGVLAFVTAPDATALPVEPSPAAAEPVAER